MRRSEKLTWLALAGVLAAMSAGPASAVSLVYRGAVTDDYGNPLAAGKANVVFRLYANAAGPVEDALFAREEQVTLEAGGFFQHTLDLTACEGLIQSNRLNYVGITVEGQEEIAPRQAILPQPCANRAETADRIVAGGQVAHVKADGVSCRTLVGNVAAEVTVSEVLSVERRDHAATLGVDLSAKSLDVRATDGMTVFSGGWQPLGATWWSGEWSALKRGKVPDDKSLTVGHRGAYFFSSLGECAGEDEGAAQYVQLQNLRNTIWRMPGVAFFGRKGDRIDHAFDDIFKTVCVEVGWNTDSFVPPQVKAAYLPHAGTLTGEEAAQ